MPKTGTAQKLQLTPPQLIPLDHLVLHDGNVRRIKAGVSIETLAADIARRGLLQSLSVRPLTDEAGAASARYGVQGGGRRLRALQLLVKQKKLAKNAPVPCIVRTEGFVEADSLAENTEREALHPIDQFRAFATLREQGQGEDTIAAAFGVSASVVKQRLRLAKASPVLLAAYEAEEISLEQLMAFCLVEDRKRQEEVWDIIQDQPWQQEPLTIRRLLTEETVHASDKRARFVGREAYEAAGGAILRDLFDGEEGGGYLQDAALLERLVSEKLTAEADKVRSEGWAWAEAAVAFPYNHRRDFRALSPASPTLNKQEEAEYHELGEELNELENQAEEDIGSEDENRIEERIAEIEVRLAEYDARVPVFSANQKARSGCFVSLADDGKVRIERGFRRLTEETAQGAAGNLSDEDEPEVDGEDSADVMGGEVEQQAENSDGRGEIADKLMTELTAYHSVGLRNALAGNHGVAYLAVLNALVLSVFYRGYTTSNCLQIQGKDALVSDFPGLAGFKASADIRSRHEAFERLLPEAETQVWEVLLGLNQETREALFAHCAGMTVNAVHESFVRSHKRRHAAQLAQALALDMTGQGFAPTAANYLGRIKKPQILAAVAEAKDAQTAAALSDHKKKDMAAEAERLLADTGWLPKPLRTLPPAGTEEGAA